MQGKITYTDEVVDSYSGQLNKEAGIYLDGEIVSKDLDLYAPDKQHRQVLYSNTDLADTEHTIKIICEETKAEKSSGSYTVIDAFTHPDEKKQNQPLRIYINRDWAYNLGWGNINRQTSIEPDFADSFVMRFTKLP